MLAVTHHFAVEYSVKQAIKDKALKLNKPFDQYMVLGDDIII
jgi:hypothetical protein